MGIISGFRATNLPKAFALNSISSSIAVIVALVMRDSLDKTKKNKINAVDITLTFIVTFMSAMLAHLLMYILFGFGDGMVLN